MLSSSFRMVKSWGDSIELSQLESHAQILHFVVEV
jgi:hypothetical protein